MYFPLRKYMTGARPASPALPHEPGRDAAVASGGKSVEEIGGLVRGGGGVLSLDGVEG